MEFTQEFQKRVRDFLLKWNSEHPVDHLWRKHHNIPFGSPEHLQSSFITQQIWFEENKFFDMIRDKGFDEAIREYSSRNGQGANGEVTMSQKDVEDMFDNLDLSKYQDGGQHK